MMANELSKNTLGLFINAPYIINNIEPIILIILIIFCFLNINDIATINDAIIPINSIHIC